ncbi:hypothetical protein U1Q18_020665 [Sarracenia purpurea var. burkii]
MAVETSIFTPLRASDSSSLSPFLPKACRRWRIDGVNIGAMVGATLVRRGGYRCSSHCPLVGSLSLSLLSSSSATQGGATSGSPLFSPLLSFSPIFSSLRTAA